MAMATLGLSKVFILDKYFTELQKYWETERKLQGEFFVDIPVLGRMSRPGCKSPGWRRFERRSDRRVAGLFFWLVGRKLGNGQ